MKNSILKLNKAGSPVAWIDFEEAAKIISKNLVLWTLGTDVNTLYGGTQRATGLRSSMDFPPIIAVKGRVKEKAVPRISNRLLFARDNNTCLYCGNVFCSKELTRDHVIPASKDGPNTWENCVTSCKRDNHRKADRTPEQAGMELLAMRIYSNTLPTAQDTLTNNTHPKSQQPTPCVSKSNTSPVSLGSALEQR